MGILLVILFFVCMRRPRKEYAMPLAYLAFEWLLIFSLIMAAAMLD